MDDERVYSEATHVEAGGGEVSVNEPDSISVKLTPEAAAETAERLFDKARVAAGQRRLSDRQLQRSRGAGTFIRHLTEDKPPRTELTP
jgi:hypothetical protein